MAEKRHHDLKTVKGRSREHLRTISSEVRKEKRGETAKRFRGISADETQQIGELQSDPSAVLQSAAHSVRNSADLCTTKAAMQRIRLVLSLPDPPIREVIQTGLVQFLISGLLVADDMIKSDAMWCLTNIGSGDTDQTREILPAVPLLLQILSGNTSVLLSEQACWVIGNIAGDSDECRDVLIKNGALKPVADFLLSTAATSNSNLLNNINSPSHSHSISFSDSQESQSHTPSQTAAWALSNLARGSTSGHLFLSLGVIPNLVALLGHPDEVLVNEVSWIFAFLTAKEDDAVDALIAADCLPCIVAASARYAATGIACIPIIRCLGNLSSGPSRWMEAIAKDAGLASTLSEFLARCTDAALAHRAVLKESMWVLANILGSDIRVSQPLVSGHWWASIVRNMVQALLVSTFDIQKEVIVGLQNALIADRNPSSEVRLQLAQRDPMEQMIRLLRVPDSLTVATTLRIIRNIAAEFRGGASVLGDLGLYDALDDIQYGPGEDEVRCMAKAMADEFFEGDDDMENERDYGSHGSSSAAAGSSASDADSVVPPPCPESLMPQSQPRGMGRGSHMVKPAWMN